MRMMCPDYIATSFLELLGLLEIPCTREGFTNRRGKRKEIGVPKWGINFIDLTLGEIFVNRGMKRSLVR